MKRLVTIGYVGGRASLTTDIWEMSQPSPVQIKEANAHLAAVHRRVAELEKRLAATENTVREQAESLIRKDDQLRTTVREIVESKDREIASLQQKLCETEDDVLKLQNIIKEKDGVISQLRHQSHLLKKICKSRPLLDNLLSYMAEAERLGDIPGTEMDTVSSLQDGFLGTNCSLNIMSNNRDFSLSEDDTEDQDLDETIFGTTV
ncbi:vimentin-type intermediate filament-associated coiled-coil protein [Protopterus annectens]|uniref:vimentin-type intermediate filament-associated coiled-coil protein n=1 Tax=Protopterus annectens TaxID=7888 RepID=UPI001CFB2FFE|nr:vimentin-type intermediate filament-associated coiled-coil protein [Protopterus annectens]